MLTYSHSIFFSAIGFRKPSACRNSHICVVQFAEIFIIAHEMPLLHGRVVFSQTVHVRVKMNICFSIDPLVQLVVEISNYTSAANDQIVGVLLFFFRYPFAAAFALCYSPICNNYYRWIVNFVSVLSYQFAVCNLHSQGQFLFQYLFQVNCLLDHIHTHTTISLLSLLLLRSWYFPLYSSSFLSSSFPLRCPVLLP